MHPQVYKKGRSSLDPQWIPRILDWAGDEFQNQRYPFADPHLPTKVKVNVCSPVDSVSLG